MSKGDQAANFIRELKQLKDPEGYYYAGKPKYQGLFGRDALITSWELLNHDNNVARNTLMALGKLQGKKLDPHQGEEPGKIIHEYYAKDRPIEWFQNFETTMTNRFLRNLLASENMSEWVTGNTLSLSNITKGLKIKYKLPQIEQKTNGKNGKGKKISLSDEFVNEFRQVLREKLWFGNPYPFSNSMMEQMKDSVINLLPKKETRGEWFQRYKGDIPWLKRGVPAYFSVDATPLFVILACQYYESTGYDRFVRRMMPNIRNALAWMLQYGMKDNFLRYEHMTQAKGLASQSWKDGMGPLLNRHQGGIAVVEVQGYAYMAFRLSERLMNRFHSTSTARKVRKSADTIKKNFDKAFWMPDKHFYCLALDGRNRQIKEITSNPGHLLITGLISKSRARLIVERLFKEDMLTPYGIRTHSTLERDFDPYSYQRGTIWPQDNWMIMQGLMKMGFRRQYNILKDSLFKAYKKIGYMPELFGVDTDNKIIPMRKLEDKPCYPQAWASGAMLNLATED